MGKGAHLKSLFLFPSLHHTCQIRPPSLRGNPTQRQHLGQVKKIINPTKASCKLLASCPKDNQLITDCPQGRQMEARTQGTLKRVKMGCSSTYSKMCPLSSTYSLKAPKWVQRKFSLPRVAGRAGQRMLLPPRKDRSSILLILMELYFNISIDGEPTWRPFLGLKCQV